MAETINLGKVLVTLEGEHDSTRSYDKYCEVTSGGNSYVSKKDVPIGIPITDTTYWQKRASKGADGTNGVDGNDGTDAYQPFKGWFDSSSALSAAYPSPQVGDFAYVKGATSTDPVAIYACAIAGTWADSGSEFNPANNQEFGSGEALNVTNIVDGLTSTNAHDILSAKQGNVLDQKVAALGLKIDEELGYSSRKDVAYADITMIKGAVNGNTGANASSDNFYRTPYIDIDGYSKVKFLSYVVNIANTVFGWAFYSSNDSSSYISGRVCDTDTSLEAVEPREYTVDVPTGAKYFRVCIHKDFRTSFYLEATAGPPLKDRVSALEDAVDGLPNDLEDTLEGLENGVDGLNKTTKDIIASTNVISNQIEYPNTGIASNGTMNAASGYNTTYMFPIKPSTMYAHAGITFLAYYDSSKNFVSRPNLRGDTLTTPSMAAYARITSQGAAATWQLNEGSTLLDYEIPATGIYPYTDKTLLRENVPADAKKTGEQIAAVQAAIDGIVGYNPLENVRDKKISILGDSISTFNGYLPSDTEGYSGTTYEYYYPTGNVTSMAHTWWGKVIETLGLTLGANCSWSGSRIIGNATSTSSAACGASDRRITDLAQNGTPDIIVVFIGINDMQTAYNATIGNLTSKDLWPKNSDLTDGRTTTISQGYGLMLAKILQAYPSAQVYCCTLIANRSTVRDDDDAYPTKNGNGVYLEDVNAKIKELANGYGVHIVDLATCGIHWGNIASMTVDGQTHPNKAGHTLIAKKVINEILRNN